MSRNSTRSSIAPVFRLERRRTLSSRAGAQPGTSAVTAVILEFQARPGSEPFGLQWMLDRLALVYGSDVIYDSHADLELTLRIARMTFGRPLFQEWLRHPKRQLVFTEQLNASREARAARAAPVR